MTDTTLTKPGLPEPVDKPMTATERRELRNIMKGEFELVRGDLKAHKAQLIKQAEDEVHAQFAERVKEADKNKGLIIAEAKKAELKLQKLIEANRVQGLRLKGLKNKWSNQTQEYVTKIIAIDPDELCWEPIGLHDALEKARHMVNVQHNTTERLIARREHEINKEIAFNALQSQDSQDFLGSIPDVSQAMSLDVGAVRRVAIEALTVEAK